MRGPLLSLLVIALVAAGCTEEPAGPGRETRDAAFDVTDMAALQSAWWTWAASAPEERNPVVDETGEFCDRDQPDGGWLVSGSFGGTLTRRCTVPAGVPVAGPAVNLVADDPESCAEFMGDAHGDVTLDGAALTLREAAAVPVTYRAVTGNPVTLDGGEFEGYGCGLWFVVPDLDAGEHVLEIRGGSGDLALSVTYELTVSDAA